MTPEERLRDLEGWLFDEYTATIALWEAADSPSVRSMMYASLQTIFIVARHLITGGDERGNVFNERLIIFTQHSGPAGLRKQLEDLADGEGK